MDIIFETTGSTAALKKWLQIFEELDDSLLMEIDLGDDLFIAKGYTRNKTIIKYGAISFADCGLAVLGINTDDGNTISVSEWLQTNAGRRVYVGFFETLGRFIKNVAAFDDAGHQHKIIVRFDEAAKRYYTTRIDFKSHKTNLAFPGAPLNEFNLNLTDDRAFFDGLANIEDSVSFKVSADEFKEINRYFSINMKDASKDVIAFNITKCDGSWCLMANDYSYKQIDTCISTEIVDGVERLNVPTTSPVTIENYQLGIKSNTADTYVMTFSAIDGVQCGRIKIESDDKNFVTIIACVRVA